MLILHGENQVESRKQLTQAISGRQTIKIGSDVTLDELVVAVRSDSLFGNTGLVVIENIFSSRPSGDRKAVIDYLLKHQNADIIIWEDRDVSAKIKEFDIEHVRKFDLPKYVFKFLDDLSLNTLQLALNTATPEQILTLLTGHIARLIMAKEGVLNLPVWQAAKIKRQSEQFSVEQLSKLNQKLLEIEYKQKTSSAPYNLAAALEIFVVNFK